MWGATSGIGDGKHSRIWMIGVEVVSTRVCEVLVWLGDVEVVDVASEQSRVELVRVVGRIMRACA